jgi:hypothetical protein
MSIGTTGQGRRGVGMHTLAAFERFQWRQPE